MAQRARGGGALRGGSGCANLRRILIVDDDAALRQSPGRAARAATAEFASLQCDSAAAALGIIGQERFDAVLLDGITRHGWARAVPGMRRAGITVPIVMLT